MEALERFELNLVIGGLTEKTPWSRQVGLTKPYFEERVPVGVPASMQPPEEFEGLQVAAKRGEDAAAYLKKKGATPLPADDLSMVTGPAAATDWKLEQKAG